jgi:hypothetical protein
MAHWAPWLPANSQSERVMYCKIQSMISTECGSLCTIKKSRSISESGGKHLPRKVPFPSLCLWLAGGCVLPVSSQVSPLPGPQGVRTPALLDQAPGDLKFKCRHERSISVLLPTFVNYILIGPILSKSHSEVLGCSCGVLRESQFNTNVCQRKFAAQDPNPDSLQSRQQLSDCERQNRET